MQDPFQYHMRKLILIKVRSLLYTILFLIFATILTFRFGATSMIILSIYSLLVLVCILLFMHHLSLLSDFLDIQQHAQYHVKMTLMLFEKYLNEAETLREHWLLSGLANHFLLAYLAYQETINISESETDRT